MRLLLLFGAVAIVRACGPARGGAHRWRPKKLTPLVFKQHEPNVDEKSLSASGLPEAPVTRRSDRFRDLVPNYNPDIKFKDEEGTGADRLMTQRCMEKLNNLAISVMNTWPGVNLRVTEGWDEDEVHVKDSLHYEGRAVDITTSDKDRSKLGMLARLAVEAGFDWVYYESRSHIHCSVKSESSQLLKSGGCFTGESEVEVEGGGRRRLSEVQVGDRIAAYDEDTGQVVFSEVLLFLDRDPEAERTFLSVATTGGRQVRVTPSHLVPRLGELGGTEAVFAARLGAGDLIMAGSPGSEVAVDRISNITISRGKGVFAPLTRAGTIVVDGLVASCYAVLEWHPVAHAAFLPVRLFASAQEASSAAMSLLAGPSPPIHPEPPAPGVHWYPTLLYRTASYILPNRLIYGH